MYLSYCVTNKKEFHNIDLWEISCLVLTSWWLDVINVSDIPFYHTLVIFSTADKKAMLQGCCIFGYYDICSDNFNICQCVTNTKMFYYIYSWEMWSLVLIWRQLDVIKFSAIAFYRTPGYCSLANIQNHVARVVILLLMIFVLITFTFVT